MKNSVFRSLMNNHFFAMVIVCVLSMAAIATLSYLGILGSWGFYTLFLLSPLAILLMMEKMNPAPIKIIEPQKGRRL